MRKILTVNNQVEFHEISSDGVILNIKAFQYGVLHYQIKNGKVVFYSNADENPWRNEVWSVDMPVTIDDEVYSTADEVAEALSAVMNDSYQEQLDALQDGLATEEGRAQAAEEALQTAIENETSRATSAETNLQSEITSVSATVATFDGRIQSCENQVSALTDTVNAEVTRATAKDAEHDALISGLSTSLQNEITRAQGAESALTNSLNNEIARATSADTALHNEILAERDRALAAESGLTNALNAEVSRSTAKDSEHDTAISGLNTSIQNEITRATSAETVLHDEILSERDRALAAESGITANLNAEISRATARENAIDNKVDAEVSRSTAKDASQDALISGLSTSLQNEINRAQGAENSLRSDLNAEISARTNADAAQLQRITALEVGKADANSVYTKTESDAKYTTKDYISGLTEAFFDAAAYDSQTKKINFYHGNTIKAQIDATSFIKDGMVDNVAISGSNLVITFNTDAGKEPISIPLSSIFDPSNYYTKSEIDSALSGKVDNSTFNTLSGRVETISGDVITVSGRVDTISGTVETVKQEIITISGDSYSKSEVDTKLGNKADLSAFTAHTADSTVHVTSSEKNTWNNKSDFSGSYNDLTDKPTIPNYSAGTNVQIQNDVISATDTKYTAGRAIDITNNVVSFTLPISAGTGENSVVENHTTNKATKNNSHAEGYQTEANGSASHAEGTNSKTSGNSAHAEGYETKAIGEHSHSEGRFTTANGTASHAEGFSTQTSGNYEHASGYCNRTYHYPNTSFGNSANTLFTVGNSEVKSLHTDYEKHNAFEVRENGDIYIADTSQITGTGSGETEGHNFYDVPMIKLQDAIGQGGGVNVVQTTGTSTTDVMSQDAVTTQLNNKANKSAAVGGYRFGTTNDVNYLQYRNVANNDIDNSIYYPKINGKGILTSNNIYAENNYNFELVETSAITTSVTSASTDSQIPSAKAVYDAIQEGGGSSYSAGDGIDITNNVISTVTKFWCGTQQQYDAISVKDPNTVYMIHE